MKKIILTTLIVFLYFLNGFCQEPSHAEMDKTNLSMHLLLPKSKSNVIKQITYVSPLKITDRLISRTNKSATNE
jgi:hypothetical protein